MPTIAQLPPATEVNDTDELALSQGGVSRSVQVGTLLAGTQQEITIATGSLLGRVSPGPGGPESIALGTGLILQNDVLYVDSTSFPQAETLDLNNTLLLNDTTGEAQLMPISLLRGLYSAGENISIDANGTITSTPVAATGNSIGAVAVGNALVINASGQLSVNVGTVSGTVAAGNDSRITGAEQTANKDQPNGYAGLDSNGLVPTALLPNGGGGSSPVLSVAGRTGNVVLTTADIGGLGSIATQSASAVNLTGGTISGASVSTAEATTNFSGAVPRTLAAHFADTLNINDFGLARNGTTDDSARFVAACQTAIAQQLKLYIPSGGPILLTDAAQQNLQNICIYGDGIRDYDSPSGYGHEGSQLWFTGTTNTPFLIGPNVQFQGINFFWPNQTEAATAGNGNLPIVYPPLFAQQSPAQNIVYFNFVDCQVTNCYDFFTALSTVAVVGNCIFERCTIYAIHNCFTLSNVPEVVFISNCLFTWGVFGSVVSVGPTYNLRNFTNTQGTWLKVVGNGTATTASTTTVGGILSSNNYVYGSSRGIWLAAGTMDVSAFANTGFDTVPTVLQGDPGCAMFSTRFTGGTWYPIYFNQTGEPDTTAILINNPAPAGVNFNASFANITIPFVNGSLAAITGSNISNLSFDDIRCLALGHTTGGVGPYYGFQFNTPNANIRLESVDFQSSNAGISNTGIQITACTGATISNCTFRSLSAPIDVETTSGNVVLIGNTSQSTQGSAPIIGTGTTNVHDLNNNWDKTDFTYNGFAPANYRAGATIGIMPVACSASAGYVGVQPSATGSGGGTRFGVTAVGTSPVSLLTNAFNEEQLRANRQVSAVNYVAVKGSLSGSPVSVTAGGADANGAIQLTGQASGATYLGSPGAAGSPVVSYGATADQSYVTSAPGNGFSITIPANCSTLLLRPAGALATGSITLPAALADGEKISVWTSKTITALTVTGASGTVVNNGVAFQLTANASVEFFWNAANATWFQQLGSGTANGTISSQNSNDVTITGGSITGLSALEVGTDTSVSASLVIDAAAGYARQIVYESASSPRWVEGVEGTPENAVSVTTSGNVPAGGSDIPLTSIAGISLGMFVSVNGFPSGTTVAAFNGTTGVHVSQPATQFINSGASVLLYTNAGSDFALLPYDDTGAPLAPTLGQPFLITRATGQVNITTLAVSNSATAPTPPSGDNSTNVATTAFVAAAIGSGGGVPQSAVGAANGVASLDSTGHVPTAQLPATVQGALNYQGAWNAATNTPTLASGTGTKGFYYTVSTAGGTTLDGISQWNAGDHAAFNGASWEKLDGLASEVISVAGRTGAVTLSTTDISGLGSMASQSASAVAITGGTAQGLSLLKVGTDSGGAVSSFIDAAAGSARQLVYQTASTTRWNLAANATAESGSNAGSDFIVAAYSDSGVLLSTPVTITRATGTVSFAAPPLVGTAIAGDNSAKAASTAYVATALASLGSMASQNAASVAVTGGAIGGTMVSATSLTVQGLIGYMIANGGSAATASSTIPSTAISGLGSMATQAASAVAVTGGTISGLTAFTAGSSAGGTVTAALNAAAATPRQIVYQTAGVSRWNLMTQGDAEGTTVNLPTTAASSGTTLTFAATTGVSNGNSVGGAGVAAGTLVTNVTATTVTISAAASVTLGETISFYPNAGSTFSVRAYDDGGNLLNTPLSIARASGAITFLGTLTTGSYAPIVIQGGSATPGNSRGLGAFDAQQYRSGAAQVASGQYSVAFGSGNTVSGSAAFAAGISNTLSGSGSHAFGTQARDWGRYGGGVLASGYNTTAGDAQRYETVLRATSTTGTAVRLTADGNAAGAANVVDLQNNQVAKLNIEIVGFSAANNAAATWVLRDVLLARGASASATSLSSTTLTAGGSTGTVSGWTAPTLAADTTNGGLTINSGYAASTTIKWVARVVSVEVM
jgi:hypothetical protein